MGVLRSDDRPGKMKGIALDNSGYNLIAVELEQLHLMKGGENER